MIKKTLLPLILLSFLVSTVWSQETTSTNDADSRTAEWNAKRRQKLAELVPEKLSTTQRILKRIEENGIVVGYKGIYGGVANLGTGSGFAPQVRFWKPDFPVHYLDLQMTAAYSTRSYQQYTLQLGRILQRGVDPLIGAGGTGGLSQFVGVRKRASKHFLYADFAYRDFPQEDFYGIGPGSTDEARTDYGLESTNYGVVGGYAFSSWGVVAGRVGVLKTNINEGTDDRFTDTEDLFDDNEAPGLFQQPDQFVRYNVTAVLDYREKPGNAHRGGMVGFGYARFNDTDTDAFDFHRYTIDARQYLSLGSVQRVLALRFLGSFDEADSGSRVPFYLMETLGGSDTLRGFRELRFRDLNRMLMQAEYRWEAAPGWELALFYDTGKVFADRDDFDFENLEDDYGFGMRFKLPESVFMRFDIARGDEGTRFYLKFSASY